MFIHAMEMSDYLMTVIKLRHIEKKSYKAHVYILCIIILLSSALFKACRLQPAAKRNLD